MFSSRIKRFLSRLLVYQVVFLWIFIRINNIEKTTGDYKDKLTRNMKYFQIENKDISDFLEDPSLIVLLICIFELISAIFGLFGSYYGNLLSTILFALANFVYFNPLLPENRISLYQTRGELFYNIGIFVALLITTFSPEQKEAKVEYTVEDPDEDSDVEEKPQLDSKKVSTVIKKAPKKKVK